MPSLTFLGAAQTVTGSKHLLEVDGQRLLVDAGLFQGLKDLRERNWAPLPIEPSTIHAVILTHAHLDHCGYLPRLVAGGFKGRVFCTPATARLSEIVLMDAAKIQEEDAEQANRRGYSRHQPALPLYTKEDAVRALALLQPVGYERRVPVGGGVDVEFINAGHLLGSAYARVTLAGAPARTIVFGGDLGRFNRPVLPDPSPVRQADVLLVESTYGDRDHEPDDDGARLQQIVSETIGRGGKVIVPAFAIGRVEEVLYWIKRLEEQKRIPQVPVYLDSPMALAALKEYIDRPKELDPDLRDARERVAQFATARFEAVEHVRHSMELVASPAPAIVIASSGMATGGRVLHHLKKTLPDPRHTILFVGFQAQGTRGRQLVDGAKAVKIQGDMVPVAARIELIGSMSAHADRGEILRWLGGFEKPPSVTFLVHGEPAPMTALKAQIEQRLQWNVHMPAYLERVEV